MKQFLFLLSVLPWVLVSCNPDEDDYEVSGCMNPDAVNFNPGATVDDSSCVYGPAACGGVSTVTFDGYTYELVAIGDQCWFAENLRTEHYTNGDAIPGELSDGEWENTTEGAQAVYDNDASSLADYGRLYNWYAVEDVRGLCPTGWHVPTDGEYMTLEMSFGMSESQANSWGWRGYVQGTQMKSSPSDDPSWDGTNTMGFSALPGGQRDYYGNFLDEGSEIFWSSTPYDSDAIVRILNTGSTVVRRHQGDRRSGFSVRCVRDERAGMPCLFS